MIGSMFRQGLLTLALVGSVNAAEVTVAHNQGEVSFAQAPQTVAVFDLAILDDLAALDVDVAGIPQGDLTGPLARFTASATAVGTLFEPDVEATKALQPDVIYVGSRSARSLKTMQTIAPTLDLGTRADDFFTSVVTTLERLGRIHQREALAAERIATLQHARDSLLPLTRGQTALVLFTINDRVMPHAPGARFGIFHDLLGLAAVLPHDPGLAGPRPEPGSPEAKAQAEKQAQDLARALAAEPDWLIVLDRGMAFAEGTATDLSSHADITASKAWQAGRVFQLDASDWYRVGGGWHVLRDTLDAFKARVSETPTHQ